MSMADSVARHEQENNHLNFSPADCYMAHKQGNTTVTSVWLTSLRLTNGKTVSLIPVWLTGSRLTNGKTVALIPVCQTGSRLMD